jgi:hypothetical protein
VVGHLKTAALSANAIRTLNAIRGFERPLRRYGTRSSRPVNLRRSIKASASGIVLYAGALIRLWIIHGERRYRGERLLAVQRL